MCYSAPASDIPVNTVLSSPQGVWYWKRCGQWYAQGRCLSYVSTSIQRETIQFLCRWGLLMSNLCRVKRMTTALFSRFPISMKSVDDRWRPRATQAQMSRSSLTALLSTQGSALSVRQAFHDVWRVEHDHLKCYFCWIIRLCNQNRAALSEASALWE